MKKINKLQTTTKLYYDTMIQAIIFDYGGTIDTDSLHWSEVLWKGYMHVGVPVTKEEFRTSYVVAERALARHPYIKPEHEFHDLLMIKCDIETNDLMERRAWQVDNDERKAKSNQIAQFCYDYVLDTLKMSRPVIKRLANKYPLVLVSNFYGNIETILNDFHLNNYFKHVVESAVVGIRKPDPRIFQLGVDALREATHKSAEDLPAECILVVGDSYSKDIVPANSIGCKTVWIRGIGWDEETVDESVPSCIIESIAQLEDAVAQL